MILLLLASAALSAAPLDQGWQIYPGDPGSVAQPAQKLELSWKDVRPGDVRGGKPALIRIPVQAKALRQPALFIPKNVFSFRIYADGKEIYRHSDESQFEPGRFTGWLWHIVDLPPLQDEAVTMHIYSAMPLVMVRPVLGEKEELLRTIVSDSLASFAVVVLSLALGAVCTVLFVRHPGMLYGSLAAFYLCMGWWLFNVNLISGFVLPGDPWRLKAEYAALFLSPGAACLFANEAIPSRIGFLMRAFGAAFAAYCAGALLLDALGIVALYRTLLPFDLITLAAVLVFVGLVITGVVQGRPEARILDAGLTGMVLFAVNDVLVVFGVVSTGMRMHWGTLCFVASMTGVVAYRIGSMNREIRSMRDNLQDLVNERTRDLNATLRELQDKDATMRQELEIATSIQSQMLMRLPLSVGRLQVHGFYRAMHEVSGDFYDAASTTNGSTAFLMADVSGHGVPAALIMTMVKAIFHESAAMSDAPDLILTHLNNRLARNLAGTGHYVTASVVVIDPEGGAAYSNGAHRPAVYLPSGDHAQSTWMDTSGLILGAFEAASGDYGVRTLELRSGDRILLYTDGIVELRNPERQHFGQMRLLRFFLESRRMPPDVLSEELQAELRRHAAGTSPDDDMTFVCLTWT